jgi:integrase/recombinase XerD
MSAHETVRQTATRFPGLLQEFFAQRLLRQRQSSPQTVASYRDAFRLLLRYAQAMTGKAPVALQLEDLDAPLILGFLDSLESERKNSVRSRNARLAAIRSFFSYASLRDPASLAIAHRVLAIPMKRFDRGLLGFLSREEIDALLAAPNLSTWVGQRDHAMLATFYNSGARVSEIISLRVSDITLERSGSVHLHGKGRKERAVPLWPSTTAILRRWLRHHGNPQPDAPVFPNRAGTPLSRAGVEDRLAAAVQLASVSCPSLNTHRISPHTLRHSTAMHLLQSGVDITVIALWLGHESPTTTHQYIEADLAMKERALKKIQPTASRTIRFKPSDQLLAFLDGL